MVASKGKPLKDHYVLNKEDSYKEKIEMNVVSFSIEGIEKIDLKKSCGVILLLECMVVMNKIGKIIRRVSITL